MKFGIEFLYRTSMCDVLPENHLGDRSCLDCDVNVFLLFFPYFLTDMCEIGYPRSPLDAVKALWFSWKSVWWQPYYCEWNEWNFTRTFDIFLSISIKFSTENFQNNFLINITFCENCCWETNSFVTAVKGISCVCESSKPRGTVSVLRCIERSLVAFPCLLTLLPFSLSLL